MAPGLHRKKGREALLKKRGSNQKTSIVTVLKCRARQTNSRAKQGKHTAFRNQKFAGSKKKKGLTRGKKSNVYIGTNM